MKMQEELAIEKLDLTLFKEKPKKGEKLKHNKLINNFVKDNEKLFKEILIDIGNDIDFDVKKLTKKLNEIFEVTQKLPNNENNFFLKLQLKCFSHILSNKKFLESNKNKELKKICEKIDKNYGKIPTKLNKINLPKEQYLPPGLSKGTTQKKWAKNIYDNPCRKESGDNAIYFFTVKYDDHQFASVRVDLIEDDINLDNEEEALCYAECDFYKTSILQADHLQSSSSIINRQKEMIYLMNVNEEFKQNIMKQKTCKKGYFVKEKGIIYGTKLFFMEYHNCIDNLWLINASSNTGAVGKMDLEPIEWLEEQDIFGQDCLKSIGEVNKESILYTVGKEDKILCLAVKEWYRKEYKPNILISGSLLSFEKKSKDFFLKIVNESDYKKKKKMIFFHTVATETSSNLMGMLKPEFFEENDDEKSESSSYYPSVDSTTKKNVKSALKEHQKDLKNLFGEIVNTAKLKVIERKLEKELNSSEEDKDENESGDSDENKSSGNLTN